jgi:hypothetical protein
MKISYIIVAVATALQTGCVSRTVTERPVGAEDSANVGLISKERVVDKRWVWVWEDEFSNEK